MKDEKKTKEQLIQELETLRKLQKKSEGQESQLSEIDHPTKNSTTEPRKDSSRLKTISLESQNNRASEATFWIMGGISALLGVIVIAGWLLHIPSLIQVLPTYVPMQFNTALCFLLVGVGLLSTKYRWRNIVIITGLIVGTIGVLTLVEYIFAVNLGIDELLLKHYITVETSHPGRMAPNTAICFCLVGFAILADIFLIRYKRNAYLLRLSGALITILGIIAFTGYITQTSTAYGWGQMTRMAVHSSVGFIFIGIGVLAQSVRQSATEPSYVYQVPVNLHRIILITPIVMMTLITTIVTLNVMRELYFAAIEEKRNDLSTLVKSWSEIITTMCDLEMGQDTHQENMSSDTCILKEAFSIQKGMRDKWITSEFIFGRKEGNQIVFFMKSNDLIDPSKRLIVSLDSELAEPMRRAILGESGTMIGLDYAGETVLSAYEPINKCGLGLVGKIDMAEIQRPFKRASYLAGGLAILIISLGSIVLLITINPTIKGLLNSTAKLKDEVFERKRSEKELAKSKNLLQLVLNTIPARVFWKDTNLTFLGCNALFANDAGIENPESIIGKNDFEMTWRNEADLYRSDDKHVLSTRESKIDYEEPQTTPNGDRIWLSTTKVPLIDFDGKLLGVLGTYHDVTERREIQDELERSEERFKAIVSAVPTPLLISRRSDGKILYANEHLLNIYNVKLEDMEGSSTYDLYQNIEDREKVIQTLNENGSIRNLELKVIDTGGSTGCVLMSSEPMIYKGEDTLISTIIDISEQKQIKDTIRLQSQIANNLTEGINLVKLDDATIFYTNSRFDNMFGYETGELIGENVNILYAPSEINPEEMKKEITSALQTEGQWSGEIHTIKKDGTPFWSRLEITSFNHSEYGPIGLNVLEDITEAKQIKERLIESNNLMNSLIDSPKEIKIFALDREYKYIAFNKSHFEGMRLIFNLDINIGMNFLEIIPDSSAQEKIKTSIDRAMAGENFSEIDQPNKDVIYESYWSPIKSFEGDTIGVTAFIRDITERVKIEQALLEAGKMAQSAEKAAVAGSWKWILETNEVHWSDNLCRLNGIEPEQYDGTLEMSMSYIHKDDLDYVNMRCQEFLTTKKPNTFEYRIITPDKVTKIVSATNHLKFNENGEIVEVVGMVQDITNRKKQEKELQEYSETQAVLLREVNHRVKNNLAAIISLLHREQEQAIEQDIESYQPLLTDLVGKIQGLSTVHSILSQSGWKPILLSRLCESIITGALHSVPSNKQFVYSVSPSTVKVNSSQAHHLTLVINELTTNVVKHALSKRDNVSISVDISRKNSNIILQYRDDGPGFPEIISNGDLSGTNIGFELIRGIVTQSLNGTVEITNKSGGVVTLTFENEKT